ncbi:phospholipid-transporting ATPase ABCA3-like [Haemaphysalis longicornis]
MLDGPPRLTIDYNDRVVSCKIMILDEPTASMDPHSRREVWELLLKARRHCCIVLTTANLYEADVLADKIAIMNRGLLWCCGSPGFLRQRFSTGYHVRIVKQPGCDVAAIEALFRRHVPRTTVKQNTNLAVEYAIGANPGNRRLTAMFKELERERHNLKIGPMSVAMASLEDVLDKVRWVVPVSVLLLSAGLRQAFTTAGLDSNRFYQDRLLYDSKRLNVHSPLGFITAKRNGDPVMQHLKALFAEENIRLTPISAEHTSARLLDFADDDPKTYNYQLLFGAIFNGDSAVVNADTPHAETTQPTLWFNGQCPHAASLLVNLYHTALLRNLTGQPSARIMLYNHPYSNDSAANRSRTGEPKPDMLQQLLQGSLAFDGRILSSDGLLVQALSGIFTPLALCFHAASFVVFPIAERCSKFKHMQMMTGLSGAVYWLSNFIFDVTLAAACAAVFVPAMLLGDKSLDGAAYIGMLALLFIAHGLATVPFSYVASTLFNDSSFGLSFMVIFIFFIGLVGALKTVILHFTETVSEARLLWVLPKAVDILFHSVPTFALTRGIAKLLHLRRENDMCEAGGEFLEHTCHNVDVSHTVSLQYCCNALPTTNANSTDGGSEGRRSSMVQPFELSGTVMVEIYVMLVESVLLLAYLGVMDAPAYVRMRKRLLAPLRKKKSGTPECQASPRLSTSPLDSDVSREAELVEKLCEAPIPDEYALVVRKLYKSYAQCRGVHNVSFALKRNQCLGIIGVAGAGKTELMHLLTGFSEPSSGSAHLGSLTLSGNAKQYISRLGYCPETLGLPEYLTGREVLELFCVLRGFTPSDTASIVKNVLSLMDLSGVANDVTRNYTPGDKRKACIALAIAGLPSVILLDEPGTGVDVSSRAQIRRSLATVREMTDCAILLTSNSMQKCEILCDRIAILLSGQLECIGSLDELRSKFGRGYTITIKLRQETFDDSEFQEDLTNDMKNEFRSCQLDYSFQGVLEYRIATTYTTWGEMFSKMAIIQKKYRFKEFYVCDTTLEQIFVSYARKQTSCTKSLAAP